MNTPKISIILPTYNVARFLRKCLDSIAVQTYKNIEVLIIIDGATDGSYEIARDFAKQDSRFHVFWQENAGSGPARNNGMDRATGEFIMFVDPDDRCENNYVENLLKLQQEGDYDIVTTSETIVFFNQKGKIKKTLPLHYQDVQYKGKQQLHKNYLTLFSQGVIHAPHGKIYKTDVIRKYNIRFPNLHRSQDIVFNYRYYSHAQSILVSDYSGYIYCVLSKERIKRVKKDYYKTIALIYNDLKNLHKEWRVFFDKSIASTFLFGSVYTLLESSTQKKEDIVEIINDATIQEIIENAHPAKKHLFFVRTLLIHKQYRLAIIIVKLVLYIKLMIQ